MNKCNLGFPNLIKSKIKRGDKRIRGVLFLSVCVGVCSCQLHFSQLRRHVSAMAHLVGTISTPITVLELSSAQK
jgi:hypothetical protein